MVAERHDCSVLLFQSTCHDVHCSVEASINDNLMIGCHIGVRSVLNDKACFVFYASKMPNNKPKITELARKVCGCQSRV